MNPIANQVHTKETRAKYKGGIVFPFSQGDDVDPWVILRCVPELALIFETKVRTPFKVVFEVCKLSELKGEYVEKKETLTKKAIHNFGESGGTGGNLQTQLEENIAEMHLLTINPFESPNDEIEI